MPAVAIPLGIVLLGLALLFLIATNKAYQYTFGIMLAWMADQCRKFGGGILTLGTHPLSFLADVFDDVNNYIHRKIGEGIEAFEDAVLWSWGNGIKAIQEVGEGVDYLAQETGHAFHILRKSTIAKIVFAALGVVPTIVYELRHEIGKLLKDPGVKLLQREVAKLKAHTGAIAIPRPTFRPSAADWTTVKRRLKALEKGTGIAAGVGAVAFALSKLGLGHLEKSQCKTNTKQLCSTNPSWLENFLLAGLTVFSFGGLVAVATYLKPLVADAADVVTKFWRIHPTGLIDPDFASGGTGTAVRDPSFGEA